MGMISQVILETKEDVDHAIQFLSHK